MYLLDTNHCSGLILGNSACLARAAEVGEANLAISAITEGELLYMAENSEKVAENLELIEDFLQDIPAYHIDSEVSHMYAKLKARIMDCFAPKDRAKRRKTLVTSLGIGENDLWIAATAICKGLILVSADRDFQRIQQALDFPLESWYDLLRDSSD